MWEYVRKQNENYSYELQNSSLKHTFWHGDFGKRTQNAKRLWKWAAYWPALLSKGFTRIPWAKVLMIPHKGHLATFSQSVESSCLFFQRQRTEEQVSCFTHVSRKKDKSPVSWEIASWFILASSMLRVTCYNKNGRVTCSKAGLSPCNSSLQLKVDCAHPQIARFLPFVALLCYLKKWSNMDDWHHTTHLYFYGVNLTSTILSGKHSILHMYYRQMVYQIVYHPNLTLNLTKSSDWWF